EGHIGIFTVHALNETAGTAHSVGAIGREHARHAHYAMDGAVGNLVVAVLEQHFEHPRTIEEATARRQRHAPDNASLLVAEVAHGHLDGLGQNLGVGIDADHEFGIDLGHTP